MPPLRTLSRTLVASVSLLIGTFLIQGATSARAEDHVLFDAPNRPSRDYDRVVGNLKAGDHLDLAGGKFYAITGEKLGNGGNTVIYPIGGGRVIRLGLRGSWQFRNYLVEYRWGSPNNAEYGVAVPEVFENESRVSDFLIVERIEGFGGRGYSPATLWKPEPTYGGRALTPDQARLMREKFLDFVRSTWRLKRIGDFDPDQLFWDTARTRWVLIDFVSLVQPTRDADAATVFEHHPNDWGWMWQTYYGKVAPAETRAALEDIRRLRHAASTGEVACDLQFIVSTPAW